MGRSSQEVDKETRQAIRDYQESTESTEHERRPPEKNGPDINLMTNGPTPSDEDVAYTEAVRGAKLNNDRVQDENAMRRRLMKWTLIVVSAQIVLSDILVVVYAIFKYRIFHQAVSDKLVAAWITVTVVQTIGILAIIARGLFDRRERHWAD